MLCSMAMLRYIPQLCKAVRATVVLLDRASCCYCCFPSDQKGTRKGRRRCFRPINLLGRTSNFQTFKSFLMSRRSSSSIAIRCTLGMPTPPQRAFSSSPPPFFRRRGVRRRRRLSLSLFGGYNKSGIILSPRMMKNKWMSQLYHRSKNGFLPTTVFYLWGNGNLLPYPSPPPSFSDAQPLFLNSVCVEIYQGAHGLHLIVQ